MRRKCRLFCMREQRRWKLCCVLLLASVFVMAELPSTRGVTVEKVTAQPDKRISGTVVDTDGNALVGVTVKVQGTTMGTVTDANGRFTLNVSAGAMLEFTYIGFVKQNVAAADNIRITMEEAINELEEVVAIGYGTVKKSDLTGAVSSMTPRTFLDQPGSSVNSILAGRAPGVVVRRANGAPGEGSTIRIRGINSILGNNDPLYVVDGNYGGMPNLYDIESIEILKDASATAIYGSRGANGVIIVTTKRGSANSRNEVKVFSDISFDHLPKSWQYDMMNAVEYAEFVNKANMSQGQEALYRPEDIERFRREGGTNWQDEMFKLGINQSHKIVFTGGNNKMKYFISPTLSQMEGIVINSSSKGYGLSAKFDAELSKRISYQIEAGLSHGELLNPNLGRGTDHTGMPLGAALTWSPLSKVYNEDGSFTSMDPLAARSLNPVLLTTYKDTRYSNNGSAVGNVKIKIIDGLVFDGKAAISFGTGGQRYYLPKELNGGLADARQTSYEDHSWLANAVLTYSNTFAENHNLSVMLGFEQSQGYSRNFRATAYDLMVPSVQWDNIGLGRIYSIGSDYGNSAMRSYFARGSYNYNGRYYLTATYRADGASKFQGKNRFSYFPSAGLAWRLSEEEFMKDWNVFQNLKIRGTWGITGSQAIGSYATYSPMQSISYEWGTTQPYTGYMPGVPGNPNLKWEETTSTDFGLDFTTLGGKLSFSFDYYRKQTDNLLSRTTVPVYNGGGSIYTNIGSISNKGFEANINYVVFENKNWSYDINLNGSHNKNTVLDLGEHDRLWGGSSVAGPMPVSPFIILPGQPLGTIYGYKYLGLWQLGDAPLAKKFGQEPGLYRYEDLNGNHEYESGDYQIIGCATPKFTWGFNNHLSWKDWDLNVLIEGLHGRDIINLTYCASANIFDNSMTIKSRAGKNRWTPENPYAEFSKLSLNNTIMSNSDQWIQDGSYVKVRNISLAKRFKYTNFANIRVALSAQNVFRFTKYKGYDPEVSSAGGSDTDAGLDWFAYPNPRSISVSISLEF